MRRFKPLFDRILVERLVADAVSIFLYVRAAFNSSKILVPNYDYGSVAVEIKFGR